MLTWFIDMASIPIKGQATFNLIPLKILGANAFKRSLFWMNEMFKSFTYGILAPHYFEFDTF